MSARRSRRRGGGAVGGSSSLAAATSGIALLSPGGNKPSDLSELRTWLASRIEGLISDADQVHSGVATEIEAANARFKKRLKLEDETSSRHLEEATRAWKSFSADVEEDLVEIQTACKELISKMPTSTLKPSFGDVLKSAENQIEGLRAKYVRV